MKNKTLRIIQLVLLAFSFYSNSFACDKTSTVVNSIVNNGNGTYTVTINMCVEPGDASGCAALEKITFNAACKILSTTTPSLTYVNSTVHSVGTITGTSNTVTWSGPSVCSTTATGKKECFTIIVVVNSNPTTLVTENGHSGCDHSATFPPVTTCTPPAVPITTSTAATCSAAEVTSVSNYLAANTYTFSPTGPTVGAGGAITGMTGTTSYTVIATSGVCSSVASNPFSNDVMLSTPAVPTTTSTAATCSADEVTSVSNYLTANTYTFSPTGPTVDAGGAITGMTGTTSYTLTATSDGCTSAASTSFSNDVILSTPAVPTTTSTAASCSAAEVTSVSNYLAANTYTFSPTGPTIDAGGAITGMTGTTSYTVTATSGGCTSAASTSFSNDVMLSTPAVPTTTSTAASCSADEVTNVSNYLPANTYTFSPTGPTVGAAGAITGMTGTTSYTVTASSGGCTSAASTSLSNDVMLSTPAVPTTNSTAATCSADEVTSVSNYLPANTYTFSPTGPTVGAAGAITGMTGTTSYTVTATSGGCTSAASTSFSNDVMFASPVYSSINVLCSGPDLTSVTVNATVSSGTMEYSLDGTTFQASNIFTSGITLGSNSTFYIRTVGTTCVVNSGPQPINCNCSTVTDNTITAPQSICSGITPASLTGSIPSIIPVFAYTYQWQSSTDNTVWMNISLATAQDYAPGALTQSTYYRRVVKMVGCPDHNSASLMITVNATPVFTDVTVVCSGTTLSSATVNATLTSGTIEYSLDGTNYQSSNVFTTGITVGATQTFYIRTVGSTCSTSGSQLISCSCSIVSGNTISAAQSICSGSTPLGLTGNPATITPTFAFTYQWQSSTDNSAWADISGATSKDYAPGSLTQSTYYRRVVKMTGCPDDNSMSIMITINPTPTVLVGATASGCAPLKVNLTDPNLTAGSTQGTFFNYWTDNLGTNTLASPSSVSNGIYFITGTLNGCKSSPIQVVVTIHPLPIADFSPTPDLISTLNAETLLKNNSIGGETYFWDFGDGKFSQEVSPYHTYPDIDTATFFPYLIVTSQFGCIDTIMKKVKIYEELVYFIPNTFTPDEDNFNNTFQPVFVSGYDPYNFVMYIYNRWGELIFETHDSKIGWKGTYGSAAEIAKEGVYTWKINFNLKSDDRRKEITGHVNLVK